VRSMSLSKFSRNGTSNGTNEESKEDGNLELREGRKRNQRRKKRFVTKRKKAEDVSQLALQNQEDFLSSCSTLQNDSASQQVRLRD